MSAVETRNTRGTEAPSAQASATAAPRSALACQTGWATSRRSRSCGRGSKWRERGDEPVRVSVTRVRDAVAHVANGHSMSSSGRSSALYHTCNCTTLANCTTLGARGDENRTRARFTRTRSPAESILIHEATTSVGEAMTCQRSRRGGSLPPPADRWRGGVGRGRRRRTRASGMLIPSWRAHLHPLVYDDARRALVTRHTPWLLDQR